MNWRPLLIAIVFSISFSQSAFAAYWGTISAGGCSSYGYRKYSAVLYGIPWGVSWEATCASQPAWVNGIYYSRPTRCVNTGTNMWGEWDVPDPSCSTAEWGSITPKECKAINVRTHSAILWNIPAGVSWETACANEPATVNGVYYSRPTRCVNTGTNMWGEWDVTDTSCPYFEAPSIDCYSDGVERNTTRLRDIPWGYSWETACANEPTPSSLSDSFSRSCYNSGDAMYGIFLSPNTACVCFWYTELVACDDGTWDSYTQNSCAIYRQPVPVNICPDDDDDDEYDYYDDYGYYDYY